jgi:hypothetical protein
VLHLGDEGWQVDAIVLRLQTKMNQAGGPEKIRIFNMIKEPRGTA